MCVLPIPAATLIPKEVSISEEASMNGEIGKLLISN